MAHYIEVSSRIYNVNLRPLCSDAMQITSLGKEFSIYGIWRDDDFELRSSLLTFGRIDASIVLLSLNRSLCLLIMLQEVP